MYFVTFLFKNLVRRKVRSALTVFGVAIAVGTMVALLGITRGFEHSTMESFVKRSVDLVVVAAGVPDQLSSDLDEDIGKQILKVPGVQAISPGLVELAELQRGGSVVMAFVHGWRPDSYNFDDVEILQGRRFGPGEHGVALLGAALSDNLKKGVGDTVEVHGENFRVIGVFRSFTPFENGGVVLPLAELQDLMARTGRVTGFSVKLKHPAGRPPNVEAVCEQINGLRDERGRPLRLSAQPTLEYVRGSWHLRLAHAMAWLTSAVASVIGAIGVLNTMVMSVFERVREIGILRAIGWSKSRVVAMVLGEALQLSVVGAALGALGALALTRWLATFPAVSGFLSGRIDPGAIAEGFGMALLLGVLGGSYPAFRAARLLPTEAFRHE